MATITKTEEEKARDKVANEAAKNLKKGANDEPALSNQAEQLAAIEEAKAASKLTPVDEQQEDDEIEVEAQKLAKQKIIERRAEELANKDRVVATGSALEVDTDNPYGLKPGEKPWYIEDGFIKDPDGKVIGDAPKDQPKTKTTRPLRTMEGARKHLQRM